MVRRLVPLAAVTVLLSAITAVLTLTGSGGNAQEGAVRLHNDAPGLFTSNRSVRSLCVDGIGLSVTDSDVSMIRDAVLKALSGLKGTHKFLEAQADPLVQLGCPPPTGLLDPSVPTKGRIGPGVAVPSKHVAFIYIVADELYESSFGNLPYGETTEELFCERRSECSGVTQGLYIPRSVGSRALTEGLLDALSFR